MYEHFLDITYRKAYSVWSKYGGYSRSLFMALFDRSCTTSSEYCSVTILSYVWLDLRLVTPSEAHATDHLSSSSSVFCCHLHLPTAVPEAHCLNFFVQMPCPGVTDWLTECLYYHIWQTADEITVDVYINVIVCTVKSTVCDTMHIIELVWIFVQ